MTSTNTPVEPLNGAWYVLDQFRAPGMQRGSVWATEVMQPNDLPVRVFFRTAEGVAHVRAALAASLGSFELAELALDALGLTEYTTPVSDEGETTEMEAAA